MGSLQRGGVLAFGVRAQADAAALQRDQRFFQAGERAASLAIRRLGSCGRPRIEHAFAQALLEKLVLHLLFGLHVVGLLLAPHPEQRRLGDVDVPGRDE